MQPTPMPTAAGWLGQPTHHAWLDEHFRDLLAFGQAFPADGGGAHWLDDEGDPDTSRGVHTWVTSRMAHVYALGHLAGVPGCGALTDAALAGLREGGPLHDRAHGGWHPSVDERGHPAQGKACYDHAFVVLAASTATAAGRPGGEALLREALAVYEQRFWDEAAGLPVDTWHGDGGAFTELDGYRGVNGAMHSTEAMLAAADVLAAVLGDPVSAATWRHRALGIAAHVAGWARGNGWRVPEHFDAAWHATLDVHADRKDDPFTPYGATVGHGLEWSRLMLHAEAAAHAAGEEPPPGLPEAAQALFARAAEDGWSVDGAPGFVYTTDWSGTPVVRDRMHWVPAEAVAAAAALARRTAGAPSASALTADPARYAAWYALWWDYVADVVIDNEHGSWHHQLDPRNRPTSTVWPGKPDLYHAVQATLLPRLPLAPSLATALRQGLHHGPLQA